MGVLHGLIVSYLFYNPIDTVIGHFKTLTLGAIVTIWYCYANNIIEIPRKKK